MAPLILPLVTWKRAKRGEESESLPQVCETQPMQVHSTKPQMEYKGGKQLQKKVSLFQEICHSSIPSMGWQVEFREKMGHG